jgi:hypothetical protein
MLRVQRGAVASADSITFRGNPANDGISCLSSGAPTSLGLYRVKVELNAGVGVTVRRCDLTVQRSIIGNNGLGGISVENSSFRIENNFIFGNGSELQAGFGGVLIENESAQAVQVFDFNAVSANKVREDAPSNGVECNSASGIVVSSNIVYGGSGGQASVAGDCVWTYSDIEGGAPNGEHNIDAIPLFAGFEDLHILPNSPCRNAASPDADLGSDIDDDPRPIEGRRDIGADEVAPGD